MPDLTRASIFNQGSDPTAHLQGESDITWSQGIDPHHLHFTNRYPALHELLRGGGMNGIEYLLSRAANVPAMEMAPANPEGRQWRRLEDFPYSINITGPSGHTEFGLVLMGRGRTIRRSTRGSLRPFYIDSELPPLLELPTSRATTTAEPEEPAPAA